MRARLCRRATELALGANGSCTCTKSSGASVSTSSIVRAMSTGGDGAPPRALQRQQLPDPQHPHAPVGIEQRLGVARAPTGSACRDSPTSEVERDGASTSIRCPRSASSRESAADERVDLVLVLPRVGSDLGDREPLRHRAELRVRSGASALPANVNRAG